MVSDYISAYFTILWCKEKNEDILCFAVHHQISAIFDFGCITAGSITVGGHSGPGHPALQTPGLVWQVDL